MKHKLRIAMITGSYPPDVCGVGAYTSRLCESLRTLGVDISVVSREDWRLSKAPGIMKRIKASKPDVIHIQYPTIGYGYSLSPQMLSLLEPCVVTIHEFIQAHNIRKASLLPFSLRSPHILFTTSYERDYALRWAPWLSDRTSIIPIGSTLDVRNKEANKDLDEILYFGLIRPEKGLEQIFALASLIKARSLKFKIRIIGKTHPKWQEYYQKAYERSRGLPILWNIGLDDDQASELLSRSKIAYLPFPDGASERRSSLLALLSHGVVTVTTRGLHTSSEMERAVVFADNAEQALQCVQRITGNRDQEQHLRKESRRLAESYTWETIAKKHVAVYRKLAEHAPK